jgi:sec-independent protein translocase protein TatA
MSIILGIIGAPEIVVILVVVVFLFGGKKIPELMKGLGQGVKEFKNAVKEEPKSEKIIEKE